jgi:uncharacterized protein
LQYCIRFVIIMSVSAIIGIIALGALVGFFSSMVGIGGGLILVPALVAFYGFNQHTAQGTTLAMLSLPVAAISAFTYYKNGQADWKMALILSIGFIIGSYFGSNIAVNLNAGILKKIFAFVMIIIAVKYLFFEK